MGEARIVDINTQFTSETGVVLKPGLHLYLYLYLVLIYLVDYTTALPIYVYITTMPLSISQFYLFFVSQVCGAW